MKSNKHCVVTFDVLEGHLGYYMLLEKRRVPLLMFNKEFKVRTNSEEITRTILLVFKRKKQRAEKL